MDPEAMGTPGNVKGYSLAHGGIGQGDGLQSDIGASEIPRAMGRGARKTGYGRLQNKAILYSDMYQPL